MTRRAFICRGRFGPRPPHGFGGLHGFGSPPGRRVSPGLRRLSGFRGLRSWPDLGFAPGLRIPPGRRTLPVLRRPPDLQGLRGLRCLPGVRTLPRRRFPPGLHSLPGLRLVPDLRIPSGRRFLPGFRTLPDLRNLPDLRGLCGLHILPGLRAPPRLRSPLGLGALTCLSALPCLRAPLRLRSLPGPRSPLGVRCLPRLHSAPRLRSLPGRRCSAATHQAGTAGRGLQAEGGAAAAAAGRRWRRPPLAALRIGALFAALCALSGPAGAAGFDDAPRPWAQIRAERPELFHAASGYRIARQRAPTPADIPPPARLVDAAETAALAAAGAVLVDVYGAHSPRYDELDGGWREPRPRLSLPGAVWLPEVGRGALPAEIARWFSAALERLSGGDRGRTLVFFCVADCWMSWNAARRAAEELGYRDVRWFRLGTDGWRDAGRALAPVSPTPVDVD